ncbi:SDR family NAD(P)-dependent oxidoreductase [Agrobacterium tumefaciens]|uniref:SDR family oxidoreductase n=1 Tax=Agrobacterium tumefaciens TaxID=358 RepID=UPI0012B92458|nr:SDR family oxidoreductase [Agrobacterium tumefaciens]MQB07912.1 SDR family NAD(P)-dependent oxidoreductase [Agrobacterium tumefaciens]
MAKVFIVGGAGKVGRRLIRQLTDRGHQALALHRHPNQAEELSFIGATPVAGSLLELDAPGLADLMTGSDVVVFSAGAGGKGGPELTNAIDGRGLELSVAAARQAGVRRFLLVSAFPDALRGKQMPTSFENYMNVKKLADVHLAESDLDWVILRPGTLSDDIGSGQVRSGIAIPYGNVSRDDVATTLAELIDNPRVNRIIIELTEGKTPIAEAVQRLART